MCLRGKLYTARIIYGRVVQRENGKGGAGGVRRTVGVRISEGFFFDLIKFFSPKNETKTIFRATCSNNETDV